MSLTVKQSLLNLEDSRLEGISKTYPEEMREDFLWLCGYLRDRCHSNPDVLEAQIKKLGFQTTASTIGKLIQGRWNTNALGEQTSPIISLISFGRLVESLRADAQLSELAGKVPFVETSTWFDVKNYIDGLRPPDRVCKFGLIIGPTGSQKTCCLKQYVIRNNHGRCHHIEAPDTPTLSKFLTDLGACYGVSPWGSAVNKRQRIRDNVNDRKTIIIDNIQRLYKPNCGWNQPVFNYLQKLQDDTNCTIIMACVPTWELVSEAGRPDSYFEQFEGRCGGRRGFLPLPDFAPPEDLIQIAEAFKLQDAKKHIKLLDSLARQRGRIRILFNVLQEAKAEAEAQGSKQLRISHINAVLGKEDE